MTPAAADRSHIVAAAAAPHEGRPPRYDTLFDRIRLGPKVTRNRFFQTPHSTSFGTQRPGAQARLRGVKAEGGWAVVNTDYCSISPESDDSPWVGGRLWDEDDVRNLSATTAAIHEHGALAGVELWYGGSVGTNLETRLVARGVSQVASDDFPAHSPYAMTAAEIRELQGFYVMAARRAASAGFDIVTIGAQEADNVCAQFLMPFYNRRRDAYGGTLANRSRFLLETLELVREAVGDRCAVSVRLCIDTLDGTDRGIRAEVEGAGVMRLADHLVDFWDVQVGGWGSAHWGEDSQPSRFSEENFQGEWIRTVREATDKPLVGVGRFTSPDTMVGVIRSGQQDLIGAARPSIADPFLPRKIEEGRFDDLRECIGCNVCVARFAQSAPIVCTQNPTLGEEYRRGWHPERFSLAADRSTPVLIVGAGPAGLECAATLGRRGFELVHLVDAEARPGGALRWIARLPGLAEWSRVIDHRLHLIAHQPGVELIPRTRLDPKGVLDYGGQIVIVATGARWAGDGISWATHEPVRGADAGLDHVFTPEQILVERREVPGEHVVIYDCDGYFTGVGLAEVLRGAGKRVTILTPFAAAAPQMDFTYEARQMAARLAELGVEVVSERIAAEITADGVRTARVVAGTDEEFLPASAVVLVTQRISDDGLFRELEADAPAREAAGISALHRIGDCLVPRSIADAVFDGHRLAREIDSAHPDRPLPFIRERRVLVDEAEFREAAFGATAPQEHPSHHLA